MGDHTPKRKMSGDADEPLPKRIGFSHKKESDMWEYVLSLICIREPNVLIVLNSHVRDSLYLWEEMKRETETVLSAQELYDLFHKSMLPNIAKADLSVQAKACLYYSLKVKLDPDFLKILENVAHVQVSEDSKLTGFRKKSTGDDSDACSTSRNPNDFWYSVWDDKVYCEEDSDDDEEYNEPKRTHTAELVRLVEPIDDEPDVSILQVSRPIAERIMVPVDAIEVDGVGTVDKKSKKKNEASLGIDQTESTDDMQCVGNVKNIGTSALPEPATRSRASRNLFNSSQGKVSESSSDSRRYNDEEDTSDEIEFLGTVNPTPKHGRASRSDKQHSMYVKQKADQQTASQKMADYKNPNRLVSSFMSLQSAFASALKRIDVLEKNAAEAKVKSTIDSDLVAELQQRVIAAEKVVEDIKYNQRIHKTPPSDVVDVELAAASSVSAVFEFNPVPFHINSKNVPVLESEVSIGAQKNDENQESFIADSSSPSVIQTEPCSSNQTQNTVKPKNIKKVVTNMKKKEKRCSSRQLKSTKKTTQKTAKNYTQIQQKANSVAHVKEIKNLDGFLSVPLDIPRRQSKTPIRYGIL
ncbi:hypothetical protein CRE_05446 [Caenorhabditis remanei]|uniref:SPK domain-containing protein n=1 Tax=Caenorhabditis remanei TaxID=31234 RepID=E3M0J8_CAERE|nr:hypothetical protein CRE_05446 [Caenorhabditis remanei]